MIRQSFLVRVAAIAFAATSIQAPCPATTTSTPIFHSESDSAALQLIHASADESASGAEPLHVDFAAGVNSAIVYSPITAWDWSTNPGLTFSTFNPGVNSVRLNVDLVDGAGVMCTAYAIVDAGKIDNFTVDFHSLAVRLPGVAGKIPEPAGDLNVRFIGSQPFDFSRVVSLSFSPDDYSAASTVCFGDVDLLAPGSPVAPFPETAVVDRYGQFAWESWPGKVLSDRDIEAEAEVEAKDLAGHPAAADRDRFGGWAAGPTLPHSSFFTTAKYAGKWALVDPDGHLFLSLGIDCVSTRFPTEVTGRESLFSWLPQSGDPLSAAEDSVPDKNDNASAETMNFYQANLMRKFGADWDSDWQKESLERLPSWGFNTIGNWSASRLFNNGRIPYVATGTVHGSYSWIGSYMADPWDPRFSAAVTDSLAPVIAKVKSDPFCVGYFVDNEMNWGWGDDIAIAALDENAASSPAKAAFVNLLKTEYTTIIALNSAWGTDIASWDDFSAPYAAVKNSTPAMKADMSAFLKAQALQYFTTVHDAIKTGDPDHLYLGCRFSHSTPEAVWACGQVCDVISFNVYEHGIADDEWNWLSKFSKPAIVGEFHFGALDRGTFRTAMVSVPTQSDRARSFQTYVKEIANNPNFIGCHWFQYVDEPTLGRPGDGENYNIGFVSITDTPYPEMVAGARNVLSNIYERRWPTPQ